MKASSLLKFIFPILVIAAVIIFILVSDDPDSVELGESTTIAETSVGQEGKTISVDNPELAGLK